MTYDNDRWPDIRFDVIGKAWRLYKQHWIIWSLAMLIVIVGFGVVDGTLLAIFGGHKRHGGGGPDGFAMPFFPGGGIVFLITVMSKGFFISGMIRMADRQICGGEPRIEDLFSVTDVWFDVLLVSLLYGLATMVGALFCFIPGLILSGVLMLGLPLVAEGRQPATAALIQSFYALKRQFLTATVFHLWLVLVASLGVLLCGIGVIFTGPLYAIAITLLYREFFPASSLADWKKQTGPFPEV